MGAIGLLNQLYKEKIQEYGELDIKAKEIEAQKERKLYRETPIRQMEQELKQLQDRIAKLKSKFDTSSNWDIKKKMQKAITQRKTEIEAKLISVTPKDATRLILEFQKWWPKV